ncbi:hypothetical protein NNA36_00850 [Shimia sp. CNT1-13L.2]|uniref:hypothetical protein n=1 Tax=Shimia sp. CNT1-13L.2 TaxID=2959663 RepID=UPI0020CB8C39|nr:hypothetical protein [Shimia sp. CNT1-13L.2]MCP9480499.1 hypothetical protein [Shimia sp. CNT1-13L.2]
MLDFDGRFVGLVKKQAGILLRCGMADVKTGLHFLPPNSIFPLKSNRFRLSGAGGLT